MLSYYVPGVTNYSDCGCASAGRGELQGFFCENYSFSRPPVAVGISQGLSAQASQPVHDGDTLQLSLTARNYSYCASPPLALYVAGRPLANPTEIQDVGGEATRPPFPLGQAGA